MTETKQRKAGILLNYLVEGIKILTALLYTPLMLRLLGQREYGLYQLVGSVVSWLGLLSFGFGSAYVRYDCRCQAEADPDGIARLNGMFLLIFSSLAALCLLCGGVLVQNAGLVFGAGLADGALTRARRLLGIQVVTLALTFVDSVFDCHITARERFLFQKLLRAAQSALNPFLTLPLLLMGYGSVTVALVSLALTAGVLGMDVFYCRKILGMRFSFRNLPLSLLGEMGVFTFFLFLNQIIDQVNWNVDKFLLGRMSGTAAVAVYGIGGQIHSLYVQMSTAVSAVFIPKVNRLAAQSADNRELTRLMARVGRVQALILGLPLTGFVFFGQAFLRLWAGRGYEQSYTVALLLMLPITIPLIQNLGLEIQRARNRHRARSLVCACLSAGNAALSILLIPEWGCVGAAAGTAVSLILGNVLFMNWYYQKRLGLDMGLFWREIAGLLPAWLLSCLFGVFLSACTEVTGWGEFLLSILLYSAVYAAVMWRFALNQREKQQLRSLFPKNK